MRAVVDTNVWVSAAIRPNGPPGRLEKALARGEYTLVLSRPMVADLTEVLNRPRIREKYQLDPVAISELIEFLTEVGHDVAVAGDVRICRDPDDDVLIETATKGSADVLVSRDEDLTRAVDVISALDSFGIRTLTVARFLALLEAGETGSSI
jgi:uncharacterized protein